MDLLRHVKHMDRLETTGRERVAVYTNLEEDSRVRIHIQESINVIAHGRPVADGSLVFNTHFWQPPAELSDWLKERGFKIHVDTSAAISEITRRACTTPPESRSTIVVVSGNSDFSSCIENILEQGWNVEIHCWKHQTLPKFLENLHFKENLLVSYLDQYLACVTYISYRDFKFKNDVPHNFKQVVLHMMPDPYRDHYKWCKELETVIRWPFQYHYQIGETASCFEPIHMLDMSK